MGQTLREFCLELAGRYRRRDMDLIWYGLRGEMLVKGICTVIPYNEFTLPLRLAIILLPDYIEETHYKFPVSAYVGFDLRANWLEQFAATL